MITIVSALLSVLSFRFRRRASLELHRPSTSTRRATAAAARSASDLRNRPTALDVALPDLAAGLERHGAGEAGDCDPMASQGFPAVLAVAIKITLRGPGQAELRDP